MVSEILSSKDVTIRKPQRCFGCTNTYPPKTVMQRQSVKDGKTVFTAYLCETCQEVIFRTIEYGDEFSEGQLYDGDNDLWNEINTEIKQPAQA